MFFTVLLEFRFCSIQEWHLSFSVKVCPRYFPWLWPLGCGPCWFFYRADSSPAPHRWSALPDPDIYRRLVGCLIYLSIIHPDISWILEPVHAVYFSLQHSIFDSLLTRNMIGLHALPLIGPLLVSISPWLRTLFLSDRRNILLFLVILLRQNTAPWLPPLVRSFGLPLYFTTWGLLLLDWFLFSMIIKPPYTSQETRSSISAPSISRLTTTGCVIDYATI